MRVAMTKEERHRHILKVAKQLFVDRGYDDVTIADVIKASDIARGTFYLHFDSLESLLSALFEEVVQQTWQRIEPILKQVEDIEACTIATVHTVFRMYDHTEESLVDVFFSGGGAQFLRRKEEALYGRLGSLVEEAVARRHHLFHQGQVPQAERNLKWTIVMLISSVANMSYYAERHVDKRDRDEFEEHLARFVVAGMMDRMEEIERKNASWSGS